MSKVVILSGIPGSGKSTIAREMTKDGGVICSADQHFTDEKGDYKFVPFELQIAHAKCMKKFIEAIQAGEKIVVVDNTNTSIEQVSPYYLVAKAFGLRDITLMILKCSPNLALERNTHNVPQHNVLQHHDRLSQMRVPATWKLDLIQRQVQAE